MDVGIMHYPPICCSLLDEIHPYVSEIPHLSDWPNSSGSDHMIDEFRLVDIGDIKVPNSSSSDLLGHMCDISNPKMGGNCESDLSALSCGESLDFDAGFLGSGGCNTTLGAYAARRPLKCVKQFDQVERAGTEVTFACVDCRDCAKCKDGGRVDATTIQEEVEQALIDRSVEIDPSKGTTASVLPFVVDPDSRLGPSEPCALKVFRGQLKKLRVEPENKMAVLDSGKK